MAIYYVYKKKYKELIIAVGVHIILTVLASLWLKMSIIDLLVLPLKVSSQLSNSGSYDIGSVFHLGSLGMILAVIILLALAVYAVTGKFKGTDYEFLCVLTMLSLIVIYHRGYDFLVLIVPFVVLVLNYGNRFIGKITLNKIMRTMVVVDVIYVFVLSKIITSISGSLISVCRYIFAIFFYATIIVTFVSCNRQKKRV
jgi:hypothetical protein